MTKSRQPSVRGDVFFLQYVGGWGVMGLWCLKKLILKRYLTWEVAHTHTHSFCHPAEHTKELTLSLSNTCTHALLRNSWRFNRQQLTGYRWEGHNLFTLYIPLTPNAQPLFSSWSFYTSNQTHTHTYRQHLFVPHRNCDKPFLHRSLFISDGGLPVSLALRFLNAVSLLVLSASLITSANVSIHCVCSKQNVQMATDSRGPAFWRTLLNYWKQLLFL